MPPAIGADTFIGRTREMAVLTAALDSALEGRGGLVMIVGEPGIGKTRLAEELEAIARERGARIARGACYEGGGAPPYWPWSQAIRSLLAVPSGKVLSALETRAAVIAEIVPEIKNMLPDLQPAPEVEPEQARFRLFESVTAFLIEAATLRPIVIVLDDLHWADQSTLDFLEFFVREISSSPVLLVGGYRDTGLSRRHPLSVSLATLVRVRGFQRIVLHGLESDDVGRLVEAVGGIVPPPALIEEIHDRTEGNPFFVAEVTRALAPEAANGGFHFDATGFRVPEGVREVIGIRLNRLSEECNRVLQTAAVIGREFDFALLAALTREVSEGGLLDLVAEAIIAGVVREVSGPNERYEFAHALIQQTLVEELSAGRRVRLHARIAGAIEELYVDRLDEHATELAHHCAEAGTAVGEEKTVRYARMAGERATASYAWVEARAYFEQALGALGEDAPDAERAAILSALGGAELQSLTYPDVQRGWDNVARAFDLYDGLSDPRSAVEVARSSVIPQQWIHGTARVFNRALELVQPESTEAGQLLARLGIALNYEQSDSAGSLKTLEQALEIARHTENIHLEIYVLEAIARGRLDASDWRGAIELGLETIELAGDTNQPSQEAMFHWVVALAFVAIGDPKTALEHTRLLPRLMEKYLGGDTTGYRWAQYNIAYLRGDLATMDDAGEVLDRRNPNDSVIRLFVGIGAWHTEKRSDLDERIQAAQEAGQIDPLIGQRAGNVAHLALAARLMDRPGDAIRVREIARSILSAPKLAPINETSARIAAGLAAVATGNVEEAGEHYQRLQELRGDGIGWLLAMCAGRLLGLLAHTAGMPEEAAAHFETALEFTGKAGYRLETAWTCHDYAEVLLDRGEPVDVEKAVSLIDDGLKIARELGLVAIEKRLIVLQEQAAAMSLPTPRYPSGLTQREVEVLLLMAKGKTTREIARELVISPRTVQRHTTNLYAKINARNRAEATAFALNELAE